MGRFLKQRRCKLDDGMLEKLMIYSKYNLLTSPRTLPGVPMAVDKK